eukprot:GEMP01001538.1.p1 GENE.GEMP01001538.1~~GEMP01001538.1.p1  ORF type:complete len:1129 (+),score=163.90 GEMP01001538.1:174-3560(+)
MAPRRMTTRSSLTDIPPQSRVARELYIPWYLIHPRSKKMHTWDNITVVALIYTALVTPFEVAFLKTGTATLSQVILMFTNRCVDVVFICDLVLQFFLMVEKTDPIKGLQMIADQRKLAIRYLTSWFIIDTLSCIPFDFIGWACKSKVMGDLKIFRVIRLLRLLKLARMLQTSSIVKRWQERISVPNAYIAIAKFSILLLIGAHWSACLWGMTGIMQLDTVQRGETTHDASWILQHERLLNPDEDITYQTMTLHNDPSRLYLICFYWSVMTITSIGYGDISPVSPFEYIMAILLMWVLGVLWAFCIGSFCGIISTMDPTGTAFTNTIDDVNRMMEKQFLGQSLKRRVRQFFFHSADLYQSQSFQEILEQMPSGLQEEVVRYTNDRWIRRIHWTKNCSDAFAAGLAKHIFPLVYAQNEEIPPTLQRLQLPDKITDNLDLPHGRLLAAYIISRGIVSFGTKVMMAGDFFGDDFILENELLRQNKIYRTLTYAEVLCLLKPVLHQVMRDFPEDAKVVRRVHGRLALIRAVRTKVLHRLHNELLEAMKHHVPEIEESAEEIAQERRRNLAQVVVQVDTLAVTLGSRVSALEEMFDELGRLYEKDVDEADRGKPMAWVGLPTNDEDSEGVRISTPSRKALRLPHPLMDQVDEEFDERIALKTRMEKVGRRRLDRAMQLAFCQEGEGEKWINSRKANMIVGIIIILNSVLIGFEAEYSPERGSVKSCAMGTCPNCDCGGLIFWYVLENIFVVCFLVELILRMKADTKNFIYDAWIMFDFALVAFAIIETYIIAWAINTDAQTLNGVRILRIIRLFRLARMLRLFRLFNQLWLMLASMGSAISALTWVLFMTLVICYAFAILLTVFLGHAANGCYPEEDPCCPVPGVLVPDSGCVFYMSRVQHLYGKVYHSMFTLFIVVMGHDWNIIALETMGLYPQMWIFFVPFVIFTNIMLLNLILGIIVDKMMQGEIQNERTVELRENKEMLHMLCQLFFCLDVDGNGRLSREELEIALESDDVLSILRDLNIYVGMSPDLLLKSWDVQGRGFVGLKEFVDGITAIKQSDVKKNLDFFQINLESYGDAILRSVDSKIVSHTEINHNLQKQMTTFMTKTMEMTMKEILLSIPGRHSRSSQLHEA